MVKVVHLKRLAAPEFWPIPKKKYTWTFAPSPGPHKKEECIPLAIIVRDILGLAETGKEAKRIIKAREILVDGRVRTDHKYPVGLLDVISIPKINKHYRVVPFKNGLKLIEIDESEAKKKILKTLAELKEEIRIKARKARDEFLKELKNKKEKGEISEDDFYRTREKIDEEIEKFNKSVEEIFQAKEKEIL